MQQDATNLQDLSYDFLILLHLYRQTRRSSRELHMGTPGVATHKQVAYARMIANVKSNKERPASGRTADANNGQTVPGLPA